jgi:hypothetical protein
VGEAVKDLGEAAVDGTATVATTVGVMAAEAVEGGAAVGREIVTGLVDTGAATVGAVRDAVSPDVALFDGPVVAAVIGAGATPAAGVTVTSEDQGDFPGDDDRADAGTAEVTGGAAPGDGVDASFPGDDEPAGDADTAEAAETTVGTGTSESNSSDGDDGFGE